MRKGKQSSILYQLRLIIFVSFTIFFLMVTFILGIQYRNSSMESIKSQLKYEDNIMLQSLESDIKNTNNSINSIIISLNEELTQEELNNGEGPDVGINIQRKLHECMINTFTTFDNAQQVMVIWNNGVSWYENWVENYSMQQDSVDLLKELGEKEVSRDGQWIMSIQSDQRFEDNGPYYVKQYVDIKTQKPLGYVILKPENAFNALERISSERGIFLFDKRNILICCTDEIVMEEYDTYIQMGEQESFSKELKDTIAREDNNRKKQLNTLKLGRGWTMITVSDMYSRISQLYRTIVSILVTMILVAAGILIFVNYYMARLLDPIRKLSAHMVGFTERLPTPMELSVRNDEAGILVSHFNKMAVRNKQLVEMLVQEKKQQEHLKFQVLQSQIKPHFLYNSLDTIYCLALMGQNEKAGKMTKLLSDYYRHVLSAGMNWVLLFEEIQQTENYLKIQCIRYQDILEYHISVDENVENVKVPKLTLQPLIENAIYHGIKPLGKKGRLDIRITQIECCIRIRIIDNGVGMGRETFEAELAVNAETGAEANTQANTGTSGFGLRSVVQRLKFYYGDRCMVSLEDTAVGTCILIELINEKEEI